MSKRSLKYDSGQTDIEIMAYSFLTFNEQKVILWIICHLAFYWMLSSKIILMLSQKIRKTLICNSYCVLSISVKQITSEFSNLKQQAIISSFPWIGNLKVAYFSASGSRSVMMLQSSCILEYTSSNLTSVVFGWSLEYKSPQRIASRHSSWLPSR